MHILIVSPWLPHPGILHAGGQHLYHTLEGLAARGHTLSVLGYGRGELPGQIAALEAVCARLTIVTPAYSWAQKWASLRTSGWRRPWQIGRRTHAEMRASLRALCADQPVDVVYFAWTEMGRYLDTVPPGVGTVLATADVEHIVRRREAALYPLGWERLRAWGRARALEHIERRAVPRAHITLASSMWDRMHLARLGPADRVRVVTPWFNADALADIKPDTVVWGRLLFVGALDRLPNQEAARWLVEEVWPDVRARHPDATLRVVGAHPPEWLQEFAIADRRLTVTGYVPNLVREWAEADVAVSPSWVGGGLLVKVAAPLAAGRPVVTTPFGNEGVAAPASAIQIAAEPKPFADAVVRLLLDRAHWSRVAAAGRAHIWEALDWSASLDALEDACRAAVALAGEG